MKTEGWMDTDTRILKNIRHGSLTINFKNIPETIIFRNKLTENETRVALNCLTD